MVPTFTNVELTQSAKDFSSLDANINATGNCLLSIPVSAILFDNEQKEIAKYEFPNSYTNEPEQYQHTFRGLVAGPYSLYPQISFLGFNLLATPSSDATIKVPLLPRITDFKQTGSSYSQDGYIYNGSTYQYKYAVAVTVETESLEGVEDWGYVYKDPSNKINHISLMQYGKSYTDTRYVYYRNSDHFSVCLYSYIKYVGDDKYYYDTPHDYPLVHEGEHHCPDGNHPHLIDLGLPSGTLWACCNVGASVPEEYGDYFAWGETEPKSYYQYSNYKLMTMIFGHDCEGCKYTIDDNYVDACWYNNKIFIGDNKTELDLEDDAAYMNWGEGWRMPSDDQYYELLTRCTWTWTTENNVYGRKIVGPNGNSLFLPAAGYYHPDQYLPYDTGPGAVGGYWSRSLDNHSSIDAKFMEFDSGKVRSTFCNRINGLSVRPIH